RFGRFGRDEQPCNAWLPTEVTPRVRARVFDCLLRDVLAVARVVLETRVALPQAQSVRERRGPFLVGCGPRGPRPLDRFLRLRGGSRGIGWGAKGSGPRFHCPSSRSASAKTMVGVTSPATNSAELFGM